MTDPTLRPATPLDAPVLGQLWVSAFADFLVPILGKQATLIVGDWLSISPRYLQTTTLAEIEGQVAGFIMVALPIFSAENEAQHLWEVLRHYHPFLMATWRLGLMWLIDSDHQATPNELYIEMVGVAPTWRGQGIGQRLIGHAEQIAQTQQADWLTLSVVSDNASAIGLYQKMGFQITHTQKNWFLKWITGHPGYHEMAKRVI